MDEEDKDDGCEDNEESKIHRNFLRVDPKPLENAHPRRKRHGARNQHKSKHFVNWLLQQKFFVASSSSSEHDPYRILDIAGGKGELSARLVFCCGIEHVTLVDPRVGANIATVYQQQVLPKLPRKWQQQYQQRCLDEPNFLNEIVKERFSQLALFFTSKTVAHEASLQSAIERSSLLIGMHADSATECIVDVALQYRKPFVVVPCCVFPNLFPQRFVVADDTDRVAPVQTKQGRQMVPVRTYEQFCDYLQQKDPRFQRSVLPFEGRNIAIWWDGA